LVANTTKAPPGGRGSRPTPARELALRKTVSRSVDTKKPFKQREPVVHVLDIVFPLWRGGGRVFPNMPDENFATRSTRRCTALVWLRSSLSWRAKAAWLWLIHCPWIHPKPRSRKFKATNHSVLVIADVVDENLYLASHNLVNILVVEPATPIRCRWFTTRRFLRTNSRRCSHERREHTNHLTKVVLVAPSCLKRPR
jgi:ribosomal protein L4